MTRWQIAKASFFGNGYYGDEDRLTPLLNNGWEPFAVTDDDIWLRRPRPGGWQSDDAEAVYPNTEIK